MHSVCSGGSWGSTHAILDVYKWKRKHSNMQLVRIYGFYLKSTKKWIYHFYKRFDVDPFNNGQVHLSLLQCVSVIECTFVLTLFSDRFVCSSGRLQPCGPRRASAQPWWCCGDPGPPDPGPGCLYRNPQFYRSHWICTQGPCQAFGCFTPVSPS